MTNRVQLVECPRDAMQGWKNFIPTREKIGYLNTLLQVGFHTLDFGSFVSPKAIPQMADTREVIGELDLSGTDTKLLAIVANPRGAEEAAGYEAIHYLGYPFSLSETFQQRNANSSIAQSLERVKEIQELCVTRGKGLVVYLSMGFGNPYGDPYSKELVFEWADKLSALGISILSLADTVGLATPEQVGGITGYLVEHLPRVQIGVHLHSTPANWQEKADAAYNAGCRRFDGALKGIGGCPMAGDALVGNMNSEWLIGLFSSRQALPDFNQEALQESLSFANRLFQ